MMAQLRQMNQTRAKQKENSMSNNTNMPASAATDVPELISDLDGGVFERVLSKALSETAAAVIDHGKKGEVNLKFKIERISGTYQVRLQHDVKFKRPTSMGSVSEETSSATVLHVGKFGSLSLAQPSLFKEPTQINIEPKVQTKE